MQEILTLMTIHFVFDFVLQSDKMALGKSKSWFWLTAHIAVYGIGFMPFGFNFWAATSALHFVTDAITSRINSKLWASKKNHWFFVGVGADQLIHLYCLAWAWQVFKS